MNITLQGIKDAFQKSGYCTNDHITYAFFSSILCDRPMIIEGAPGVGKTSSVKALADGLGMPFLRVQMYEGLTADQILYDYDYQKQLLTLEAIKPKLEEEYKNIGINEAIQRVVNEMDFYGTPFLIKRPVLKSILSNKRVVLLFDEIDRAAEEVEYMLYEFLENGSISIPQHGEIFCDKETLPLVFFTSNNYRELSGALKRRCNYLYIEQKTREEIIQILIEKANADMHIATGIAKCLQLIQGANVRQIPSISEAIEFAVYLNANEKVTKELVMNSLGILIKNHRDENVIRTIVSENGEVLWRE